MVERFDVAIKYPCGRDPYAVMVSVPDGSYVMAAHYDAARAEIERLTADAQSALEAYGREKVREGMQKAANIARRSYERNKRCPDGCNCGDGFHIEQRILAEMEALK